MTMCVSQLSEVPALQVISVCVHVCILFCNYWKGKRYFLERLMLSRKL